MDSVWCKILNLFNLYKVRSVKNAQFQAWIPLLWSQIYIQNYAYLNVISFIFSWDKGEKIFGWKMQNWAAGVPMQRLFSPRSSAPLHHNRQFVSALLDKFTHK
jgi:hypothetical protein